MEWNGNISCFHRDVLSTMHTALKEKERPRRTKNGKQRKDSNAQLLRSNSMIGDSDDSYCLEFRLQQLLKERVYKLKFIGQSRSVNTVMCNWEI